MTKPAFIIAEAGVNHNGNIELAKRLIESAKQCGADAVKFQTFQAEKVVTRAAVQADYQIQNTGRIESQYEMIKRLEISFEQHVKLLNYCNELEIEFMSSAFDLPSIDLLVSLHIRRLKIPSGEITNLPYLNKISACNLPTMLSTGMSTLSEVEDAISVLIGGGLRKDQITILQCNTEYPTPFGDVNLCAMKNMGAKFDLSFGYSDHTLGIEVPVAAVAMGASVIEKHITTDRSLPGPDHRASLEPTEFKKMVQSIRNVELAMGDGIKVPSPSEMKNKGIARKSIHLASAVEAGKIVELSDIEMQRPGNGISPMLLNQILGKKFSKSLPAEHLLAWDDLLT